LDEWAIVRTESLFTVLCRLALGRSSSHTLLDVPELTFLGEKTVFLESLLSLRSGVFGTTHNTSPLVHHQMGLGKFTRCLVRSAIPHLLSGTKEFLVSMTVNVVKSVFVAMGSLHLSLNNIY